MVSEAQKRANAKYRKESMKQVTVRFSPNEMDVYEYLKGQLEYQSEWHCSKTRLSRCRGFRVGLPVRTALLQNAESFASMTGGKPNAHGKALNEWLKRSKFKKG